MGPSSLLWAISCPPLTGAGLGPGKGGVGIRDWPSLPTMQGSACHPVEAPGGPVTSEAVACGHGGAGGKSPRTLGKQCPSWGGSDQSQITHPTAGQRWVRQEAGPRHLGALGAPAPCLYRPQPCFWNPLPTTLAVLPGTTVGIGKDSINGSEMPWKENSR